MKFNKLIRLIYNFILIRYFNKKKLINLNIHLTNRCNYSCNYCSVHKSRIKELDIKFIEKIIKEIKKDCCFVSLTGGEPLLHPQIDEIVDLIHKKDGIHLSMFTNGTLVKNKINVLRKIDQIFLSYDGTKLAQEKNRGKNSYLDYEKASEILNKNNIPFNISCVLTKINIDNIEDIIKECLTNKTPILFQLLSFETGITDENYSKLQYSEKQLYKALIIIKKYHKKGMIVNSKSWINSLIKRNNMKKCYTNNMSTNLLFNKKLFPCCRCVKIKDKNYNFDSIIKEFKEIKKPNCNDCYEDINLLLKRPFQNIINELPRIRKL